ncbi:hypothetical protein ACOME3_006772 [Neoechinorhynchus agilis]
MNNATELQSLAPTLADLYMRRWENNLKKQPNIKKWYRYVDDVFIVTDDETSKGDLSIPLNMEDPSIQWSMTQEDEEGAISFLDVKIKHDDKGNIKTQLYRKPGILKRQTMQETKSGIYKIPCAECPKVYIGQTMQGIRKRISQHKQACRTFDKSSAISNHQQTIQHRVDFEKARFITSEPDLRRRQILEAIHIRGNPTMEGNKSNHTLVLPKLRGNKPQEVCADGTPHTSGISKPADLSYMQT